MFEGCYDVISQAPGWGKTAGGQATVTIQPYEKSVGSRLLQGYRKLYKF